MSARARSEKILALTCRDHIRRTATTLPMSGASHSSPPCAAINARIRPRPRSRYLPAAVLRKEGAAGDGLTRLPTCFNHNRRTCRALICRWRPGGTPIFALAASACNGLKEIDSQCLHQGPALWVGLGETPRRNHGRLMDDLAHANGRFSDQSGQYLQQAAKQLQPWRDFSGPGTNFKALEKATRRSQGIPDGVG